MMSCGSTDAAAHSETDRKGELFLALARAVTVLAEHDGLRSFSLPYPREAQLALDRVTLHCLDQGWTPPKGLPELLSWCTRRTMSDPLFGTPPVSLLHEAHWIDPVGLMPTRSCLELAPLGQPGRFEQDALDALASLERRCGSADRFSRCRKFLAHHALVTQEDRIGAGLGAMIWNKVRDLYEPVPEALIKRQVLVVCGSCGLPARTRDSKGEGGPDTWCEGEVCPPGVRFQLVRKPGRCLILRRSLRTFLAIPTRTEQETLDELARIGGSHFLLPDSGLGTYRVTGDGVRACLVQVHDRRQPALLGARVSVTFANASGLVLVVVPRRAIEQTGYRAAFDSALSHECRGRVVLTTPDDLERHLRAQDPSARRETGGTHA